MFRGASQVVALRKRDSLVDVSISLVNSCDPANVNISGTTMNRNNVAVVVAVLHLSSSRSSCPGLYQCGDTARRDATGLIRDADLADVIAVCYRLIGAGRYTSDRGHSLPRTGVVALADRAVVN